MPSILQPNRINRREATQLGAWEPATKAFFYFFMNNHQATKVSSKGGEERSAKTKIQNRKSMAAHDSAGSILVFAQFQSKVDEGFWHRLSSLKLNKLGIDDSPIPITGTHHSLFFEFFLLLILLLLAPNQESDFVISCFGWCSGCVIVVISFQFVILLFG